MGTNISPLIHAGTIKDILIPRFRDDDLIRSLIMPQTDDTLTVSENWNRHCFDTAYPPGLTPDSQVLLFLETEAAYLKKSALQIKLTISAYASSDLIHLSSADKQFYMETYGLGGNRIDMITAAIHQNLTGDPEFSRSLGIGQIKLSEDKDPVTAYWSENGCYGKSAVYTIYR